MQPIADLVAGKTVALVGNAASILREKNGESIDAHQIVIRMNLGLPERIGRADRIGMRTDIWATAKCWGWSYSKDAPSWVFMKPLGLTKLGDEHWLACESLRKMVGDYSLYRWPMHLERDVRDFVGADPGTGVRLLYWLKRHASPLQISLFGFDCWQTPSHWSNKGPTSNHSPKLEQAAIERLLCE